MWGHPAAATNRTGVLGVNGGYGKAGGRGKPLAGAAGNRSETMAADATGGMCWRRGV